MIAPEDCDASYYIGVDLGTTNTRVWLLQNALPVERLVASVGVRDTAKNGSNGVLKETLRRLIAEMMGRAEQHGVQPRFVIGAGMLTSALGLKEIPHISGVVGPNELCEHVVTCSFPDVTKLPFLLIPGVKTGTAGSQPWEVGETDVIRGEETLCVGLHARGIIRERSTLINLGSHWKAILIGPDGQIERCSTDLSGEMIFAIQTQTILADAVLPGRPEHLDEAWIRYGIAEERLAGLARTLFCVRLLDLDGRSSARQRLSYMVGAFVSQTLSALMRTGMLQKRVILCGTPGVARAWAIALREQGSIVEDCSGQTEALFIQGLSELSPPRLSIVDL
jgi:2-dehydro-3-deoxygalactonokinase